MTCRTAWAGEQLHDVEAGTPVAIGCHALGAVPVPPSKGLRREASEESSEHLERVNVCHAERIAHVRDRYFPAGFRI
jgi:hypothetical protein